MRIRWYTFYILCDRQNIKYDAMQRSFSTVVIVAVIIFYHLGKYQVRR